MLIYILVNEIAYSKSGNTFYFVPGDIYCGIDDIDVDLSFI